MPSAVGFCPQCGTRALAGAKFCAECGTSLGATPAPTWRLTAAGSVVLGFFLVAGLGIWTAILSPAPPRPGPGAAAPRPSGQTANAGAATADATAAGHPPMELPADVKSFIVNLETQAKERPKEIDPWLKLARVKARAARIDPSYQAGAVEAFERVLAIDPKHVEALRGLADVHYDREDHARAIPLYEKYLALRPDDPSALTDLGTMYLYAGDATRAIATYRDVIRRHPTFLQAHYNLAVTYHRQGNAADALAELQVARGLANEDSVRQQIDDMIASLSGKRPVDALRSPFQQAVEQAFRSHPIMGPRIARFDWPAPTSGRVLVKDFPMEGMPGPVREKFLSRLGDELRSARGAHKVDGTVRVEIADANSGVVMAAVTP
jgi:tetratricopeptide (TPR) repeat protein